MQNQRRQIIRHDVSPWLDLRTILVGLLATMACAAIYGCAPEEEAEPSDVAAVELPAWVDGSWVGRLYQEYEEHSWEVFVELNREAGTYEASYPGLGCRAELEPAEANQEVRLQHRIVEGVEDCLDPGQVVLNMMDGELYYGYFSAEEPTVRAYGLLQEEVSLDEGFFPAEDE